MMRLDVGSRASKEKFIPTLGFVVPYSLSRTVFQPRELKAKPVPTVGRVELNVTDLEESIISNGSFSPKNNSTTLGSSAVHLKSWAVQTFSLEQLVKEHCTISSKLTAHYSQRRENYFFREQHSKSLIV